MEDEVPLQPAAWKEVAALDKADKVGLCSGAESACDAAR